MYDYRQLSMFWQSIRPIQGSTKFAVQFNGQTIIPQDFDFIQKNGIAYIYDKVNDKLFDQYLNYYQNGTYFNSDGTPQTQVRNDNIIDVEPENVYKHTPHDGIEYFDSDGNSLGYKKEIPKYKPQRGPKLKEKITSSNSIADGMEFIHYGHDHFDKDLFTYVNNTDTIVGKPKGGLWSSPVNAEYGWKDFISEGESWREEYLTKSFRFRLNEKANILSVNTLEELERLPTLNDNRFGKVIDYEKLVDNGYDALLINMSNDYRNFHYDTRTMAYDVDTLLVFNPEMVEEIPKEETTVTIEDNAGVKTETISTKETNIPDSSTNQNNAEKIKQEEPISEPDKPKEPKTSTNKQKKSSQKPENKPPQKPEAVTQSEAKTPQSETKRQQAEVKTPKPDASNEKPKYKPKKGPKLNSSTVNATKEQIEKTVKDTGMKTKKLAGDAAKAIGEGVNWGKVGKIGAVVGVAALVGGGVYSHAKKEKENRKNGPDRLTGATRKSEFWNQSYAAQMAKDISTYQYGKRMTGFVQG
jgi:hypothetical protein